MGRASTPHSANSQSASATTAQSAPRKKNGRKPPRKNGGDAAIRARRSASIRSPRVVVTAYALVTAATPPPRKNRAFTMKIAKAATPTVKTRSPGTRAQTRACMSGLWITSALRAKA